MKNVFFALLLLGVMSTSYSQLNSYKYIIVPKKFDIFSEENLHHTSTLVKYLFQEEGFNVVYDDALPEDVANQRCLGVEVDLEKRSTLLQTHLTLVMKDCAGMEVFRAEEGSSREKEFRKAYHEAIRASFVSFSSMDYKYTPEDQEEEPVTVSLADDIKNVGETESEPVATEGAVVQIATPEEQLYKDRRPQPSTYLKDSVPSDDKPEKAEESKAPIYKANKLPNGYELIDENGAVWLTLFETSTPDVFLAKEDGRNGMIYKKESDWFFEYYEGDLLKVKELQIQF